MNRSIQVLYFANLREQLGKDCEVLDVPDTVTNLQSLREWMAGRGDNWAEKFGDKQKLMASVNHEMAKPETLLNDGDEIAFFPPVTGG